MEIARTENIENEGLVKHYDQRGRLVKIEFTRSGNSCTIQYPIIPPIRNLVRIVNWSNGYNYLVTKVEDITSFTEVKNGEPVPDDLKTEEAAR